MSRRHLVLAVAAIALAVFTIAIIAHGQVGPAVPMALVPVVDASMLEAPV